MALKPSWDQRAGVAMFNDVSWGYVRHETIEGAGAWRSWVATHFGIDFAASIDFVLLSPNNPREASMGIEAILALPYVKQVELVGSHVNDEVIVSIAKTFKGDILTVYNTSVTDQGLRALRRCGGLKRVYLNQNAKISGETASSYTLPNVSDLRIHSCPITDRALREIAGMAHLSILVLDCESITDAGVVALSECQSLQYLSLPRTARISNKSLEAIRKALPAAKVVF